MPKIIRLISKTPDLSNFLNWLLGMKWSEVKWKSLFIEGSSFGIANLPRGPLKQHVKQIIYTYRHTFNKIYMYL